MTKIKLLLQARKEKVIESFQGGKWHHQSYVRSFPLSCLPTSNCILKNHDCIFDISPTFIFTHSWLHLHLLGSSSPSLNGQSQQSPHWEPTYGFYLTYTAWVYFWRISFSMLFDFLKFVTGFILSWLFYFLNGITETFLPKTEHEHILPWAQWLGRPQFSFLMIQDLSFYGWWILGALLLSIEHNAFPLSYLYKTDISERKRQIFTQASNILIPPQCFLFVSHCIQDPFSLVESLQQLFSCLPTHTHTPPNLIFLSLHFQPHGNF